MDRVSDEQRERIRARLVRRLVEFGYDEPDAHFAVALYFRETRGNIVADPPLTKEQFRAMGLDRDFLFEDPSGVAELLEVDRLAARRS